MDTPTRSARDGRQIKLLIASTVPETIRAFLLPYADHFRAIGWQVDALARGADGVKELEPHFDRLHGVDWSRSPFDRRNFTCAARVAAIARENEYDIVHVHTPIAAYSARRALRGLRASGRLKVVYTAHGFHFFRGGKWWRNLIFSMMERRAARWTDRIITINREDFTAARRMRLLPREQLIYMPGIGLDFSRWQRDDIPRDDVLSARRELGLKEEDVLFTMPAEFNPGKRHRDALTALARADDPRLHIAFAGDGALRARVQDTARALGVERQVHFLGFVKNLAPLMAASRAVLMPSEREGLSRSAMEAACLGTPIIGSDARGVRDIVEPERGLLFPVGDPLALRDAMLRAADEPLPPVSPDPSWRIENLIEMHERLYGELLAELDDMDDSEERERHEAARAEAERLEEARRAAEGHERDAVMSEGEAWERELDELMAHEPQPGGDPEDDGADSRLWSFQSGDDDEGQETRVRASERNEQHAQAGVYKLDRDGNKANGDVDKTGD